MKEIYGWRSKRKRGLRDCLNFIFVVACWLHQYTVLHLCSTCCNRCVYLFFPVWLHLHCQGHHKVICFLFSSLFFFFFCASHIMSWGWNSQKLGRRGKKKRFNVGLNTSGDPSVRRQGLAVIHSHSALLTPTDVAAEDPLEEDFCRRKQNSLPGLGSHQRYLRNSTQNPSEEEEEHGLQSHGLMRGPPTRHCRAD